MTVTYHKAFWLTLRGVPWWKLLGFVVFNVGGASYASIAPTIDSVRTLPAWSLYLLSCGLLLLTGSGIYWVGQRTWEHVETERMSLAARLRPSLTFVFDVECSGCSPDKNLTRRRGFLLVRNIGVRNSGAATVEAVRVYLDRISPTPHHVFVPTELRPISHERMSHTATSFRVEPMTVHPSGASHDHVHFVVAGAGGVGCPDGLALDIAHTPLFPRLDESIKYEGTLRVVGKDVQPAYAEFLIENWELTVTPPRSTPLPSSGCAPA